MNKATLILLLGGGAAAYFLLKGRGPLGLDAEMRKRGPEHYSAWKQAVRDGKAFYVAKTPQGAPWGEYSYPGVTVGACSGNCCYVTETGMVASDLVSGHGDGCFEATKLFNARNR